MSNTTYSGALDLVKTTIQGLSLSGSPTVSVRKLPNRDEQIDGLVQIIVCPADRPEDYQRAASGGYFFFSPLIQVVIVAANNGETDTNLSTYLGWRESIVSALSALTIGVALKIEYDVPFDRAKVAQNYDYMSFGMRVTLWN